MTCATGFTPILDSNLLVSHVMPGAGEDNVLRSSSFFDDGVVDSLGLQHMLLRLETKYAIEVDEDGLVPENFETISGMALLVKKLQGN